MPSPALPLITLPVAPAIAPPTPICTFDASWMLMPPRTFAAGALPAAFVPM